MRVHWYKCRGDVWCTLDRLDLSQQSVQQQGVYIIWRPRTPTPVIYVGHVKEGTFGERFADHLREGKILRHVRLHVTWAVVPPEKMEGVVRFLTTRLHPLESKAPTGALPVVVNMPLLY